ncbi:desumoylating isopeptidase 1-like protein [Tanacetum coccineum]
MLGSIRVEGEYSDMSSNVEKRYREEVTSVGTIPPTTKKVDDTSAKSSDAKSKEENKVPPALAPAGTLEEKPVAANPLGDARRKVQEEIGNEFATMMASGTLCANEAAALATKKVMQKYVI